MNLSKTAEYALRVMIYMGVKDEKMYSAKLLVKELKISDKYLRRILTMLTKAGLVNSVQGRGGGYILAQTLENISMLDIIKAVDDINKYSGCILGFEKCSDTQPCALHSQWAIIRQEMFEMFKKNTLKKWYPF